MIELFLLVLASVSNNPLYDEVISEHTVYFDVEGKHSESLKLVDNIKGWSQHSNPSGFYSAKDGILIEDGKFGFVHNNNPDGIHLYQGCTPFLHERYHALYGDWRHEHMPYGCEGVW